jgi:transposase InsO family protein
MALVEYLVSAVLVEGRSVREVAAAHGVSKSWLYELLARYRDEGAPGLVPRSRRPHRSPTRMPASVEDEIVRWRKRLTDKGVDAGPATIHAHMSRRSHSRPVPSEASIWRALRRRGFITPQPQKRPRSSYVRFAAELPNECWQADITSYRLTRGRVVQICNIIDDHSRLLIASRAATVFTSIAVLEVFTRAVRRWGEPASLLTDNGAVFTAAAVGGRCALETHLAARGIKAKHSRPYHPQTCGKVERLHQSVKKWLDHQPRAHTLEQLQHQLDRFTREYNTNRPHRALGRRTPLEAFTARTKASPTPPSTAALAEHRVRRDIVDSDGKLTLRYAGKLRHLGVGTRFAGTPVRILVADRDVRVLANSGQQLGRYRLDPTRNYHARIKP